MTTTATLTAVPAVALPESQIISPVRALELELLAELQEARGTYSDDDPDADPAADTLDWDLT